jgi:EAL domain-containing protein (putative c-di-GMP-specific phosphodiesterase class I)
MEAELWSAVDKHQFVVHYQPELDLRTGRICGAEALVRWLHPEKGLVPPMQFIPLAEETGIIVGITEYVALTACRQAKAWLEEGFPPLVVAVNISGRAFRDAKLMATVSGFLKETALDPALLEIEITESVAMSDSEKTVEVLQGFHGGGIRVAIDDFGTGYSSLAYLRRFPINMLKIDRAFIKDMMENPEDRAIVDAIIGMGHALGMEVLAEGVERADQLEYLRAKKCDKAQGYFFSKPVLAEEFCELLRRQGIPARPVVST